MDVAEVSRTCMWSEKCMWSGSQGRRPRNTDLQEKEEPFQLRLNKEVEQRGKEWGLKAGRGPGAAGKVTG